MLLYKRSLCSLHYGGIVSYCVVYLQGPQLLNKYIGASELAVRDTFIRFLTVTFQLSAV